MRVHSLLFIIILFQFQSFAQNTAVIDSTSISYNLQQCIEIALQNNLDYRSSQLRKETAHVNFKQSVNALLPTVNGFYDYGLTDGRSIDPFTNSYINQKLTFSNGRISGELPLFNGFRLINRWKQQKYNLKASEMEEEESRQNLILDVTLAYLQALNNRDLIVLAENRLESTNRQLTRLTDLFNEEVGNPADFRDFEGLQANDETAIITAINNYKTSIFNLQKLMNVDVEFGVEDILIPESLDESTASAEEIYLMALNNLATVKASEWRLDAAEKGVAVARSLYTPDFSLFGILSTNYSSSGVFFTETGTAIQETNYFTTVNGERIPISQEVGIFSENEISYRDQFENNLSKAVGLSVRIPIMNGFNAKNNVQLEKIKAEEAEVELNRTKLDLRTSIDQAYNDLIAAYQRLETLEKQVAAYQESLRINEIRFNNGASTSVDYIISKNNLDNSQINLNNVKYEIVLREKILEYYKGNI